jgi:hypothetical protein
MAFKFSITPGASARKSAHTRTDVPSDRISSLSPRKPELAEGKFSVHVATTTPAVEDLRPIWKKWTHSLDTDIDYYLHNLRSDPTILCPYVITVCEGGIAQAMLVGLLRRRKVSAVVSWVRITGPTARVLEITKGGRVGRQSSAIDKLIALQLSTAIKFEQVDLLCFQSLPLHSELLSQIHHLPKLGFKHRAAHTSYDSVLFLTAREGKRAPVFSGKTMREVRRKTRNLQRAFPNKARFKCFSDPAELDVGIRDATTIAATTWQCSLGYGLVNTCQVRESFKFFAKRGWLRIYILYMDDLPCAFLIGQLCNTTFYCQYAGYDNNFARFSVGSLLTAWALESLAETGVQRVDLGDGSQEYLQRLGCQTHEEVRLHVYSPTLHGLWLNVFFATTQIAQAAGRRIRSGLRLNWIGKTWRDFLVTRSMWPRTLTVRSWHLGTTLHRDRRVVNFDSKVAAGDALASDAVFNRKR